MWKKNAFACTVVLAIGMVASGCGEYCGHCRGDECTLVEGECGFGMEGNLAEVQQAIESSSLSLAEAGLFAAAIDAYDGTQTENQMILQVQERLENYYRPAACASPHLLAYNTLGIDLHNCTGPFGERLNGDMEFVYQVEPDRMVVHVNAHMLEINGDVVNIESLTASYNDDQPLDIKVRSSAVTSSDWIIYRTGHYDMTWDLQSGCLSINGDWHTSVDNDQLNFDTQANTLEYCRGSCPLSGEVSLTRQGQAFASVEFNGSGRVPWSSDDGSSGLVDLACNQ